MTNVITYVHLHNFPLKKGVSQRVYWRIFLGKLLYCTFQILGQSPITRDYNKTMVDNRHRLPILPSSFCNHCQHSNSEFNTAFTFPQSMCIKTDVMKQIPMRWFSHAKMTLLLYCSIISPFLNLSCSSISMF